MLYFIHNMSEGENMKEIEIIEYPHLNFLNIFVINIISRLPHIHKEFEIITIIEGTLVLQYQNKKVVLEQGDIFLINSNEMHEVLSNNNRSVNLLCIQLDTRVFNSFSPSFKSILFTNSLIKKTDTHWYEMVNQLINLSFHYFKKDQLYGYQCFSDLTLLIKNFLMSIPYIEVSDKERNKKEQKADRMIRILEYIDNYFDENITLANIAEKEFLSKTYLSSFFKSNMGLSYNEYVNYLRASKAQKLLDNSNLTLLDICYDSGFSDMRYFNKYFYKRYKMLPKEYRLSNKQNKDLKLISNQPLQQVMDVNESLEKLEEFKCIIKHRNITY